MKHLVLLLALCVLFVSSFVFGQIPKTISYQGLLTSSSGAPLEGSYDLKFTFYPTPAGGSILWSEPHTGVTVSKGTFNVILGVDSPFTSVNFAQQLYMEVMEGTNIFNPRSALTSASTALVSNAVSGDGNVGTTGVIDATGQSSKIRFHYDTFASFPSATTYHGMFAHAHDLGKAYVAHAGSWIPLAYEDHQHSKLAASDGSPSDAVSVNANGNVGIGTTSPSAKIEVQGQVKIVDGSQAAGKVLTSDASGLASWQPSSVGGLNGSVQFNSSGTFGGDATNFFWDNTNKWLGIGTTTPNEQLEITGNLRLPFSTASAGVIKFGVHRFIHNFGTANFFAGQNAGNLTMTGSGITGVGVNALFSNTTGNYNTAIGYQSLYFNTTGNNNTTNGAEALYSNTTGISNTANGYRALYFNTTGSNNTANSQSALYSNTTGNGNTANGSAALIFNTTGSNNTAIGFLSLYSNTTGDSNTSLGYTAGRNNSTGSGNVFLGYEAGYNETGSNKLYIANSSANPPLIYGDFSTGSVGVGTISPQGALDVSSTTGAFIVPRMTTVQRDALTAVNGMIIYNTTTNQFNFYENGAWVTK